MIKVTVLNNGSDDVITSWSSVKAAPAVIPADTYYIEASDIQGATLEEFSNDFGKFRYVGGIVEPIPATVITNRFIDPSFVVNDKPKTLVRANTVNSFRNL